MQNVSRLLGEDRYYPDYIDRQYNNYTEAMFWGCFTYDYKGLCYIYYKETEEQKEDNEAEIERINEEEIEAECRAAFTA
jgi:nitrogen regulatory protein PII-like uncharacterized protein